MKKPTDKRKILQALILAAVLIMALLHAVDNAFLGPHALCPFAGLGTLYSLATTGEFIHRIHSSAVFLLLAVLLTALLAGRAFCGWLCPFGTLNEWMSKAGKRLGIKKQITVPKKLDVKLRYLKYLLLVFVLYFTWTMGRLFYRAWCPWHAFMTVFDPAEIVEDVLIGFIILLILLGISLFIERFFCRYLCPMGAAITIFNRLSIIKPLRKETCSSCRKCDKACPAGIKVSQAKKINDPECIRCYRCFAECSEKNSLAFNIRGIKPLFAGILVLLVFTGTVTYSVQAGYWERGRVFIKDRGDGAVRVETPEGQDDAAWGQRIFEERREGTAWEEIPKELEYIKAFTTLAEVSETEKIPLDEILFIWNITGNYPPETTISNITEETGITRKGLIILLYHALKDEVGD